MTPAAAPSAALVASALLTVQVLFGLNYVFSKVVVDVFPPLVWANIRCGSAGVVLLLIALLTRRKHAPKGKSFFGPLVLFACLGTLINQGAFLSGLSMTTSTNAAVLNTLIPVFTLFIATLRGQEAVSIQRIVGFIFAFGGVLVLRNVEEFSFSDQTAIGDALMILNAVSFSCFLVFSKKFMMKHDRLWATAWLFLYSTLGFTGLSYGDWVTFELPDMNSTLVGCMIYAILGGTLMTYFLNNWALAYARSSNVAIGIYIQPVIAAVLAWAWRDEEITLRMILSALLIFFGFLMALFGEIPRGARSVSGRRGK